jgi:hypothetical protein
VLEKLSRAERVALLGHELAYPGASPSHVETARISRLTTELYADRGGAVAADSTALAIATLIKTMTGLLNVDTESISIRNRGSPLHPNCAGHSHSLNSQPVSCRAPPPSPRTTPHRPA